MCKVLIMSGITDETKDKAWEFIKVMSKEMSAPNTGEKDGIGYAAIDNEGKLFGEKWMKNADGFQHRNVYGSEIDDNILKRFKILKREKVYGNFGKFNENIRSITLHSRSSTNTVSLKNTHPFVEGTTSVIHNGMIYNDDKFTKKYSTCDSEVILHQYIKYNVANKIGKFRKIANRLEGYYVLGIFAKTNEGRVILDIVKDSRANLDAFFIKELNTVVFATPKGYGTPVEDACKTLGFTIVSKYEVMSNKIQRLDAMTGETICIEGFKPKADVVVNPKTQPSYLGYDHYTADDYSDYYTKYSKKDKAVSRTVKEETFNDVFKKTTTTENNVLPMPSHSKEKHEDIVKERLLEDMLTGDKEYTQEEIDVLIKNSDKIAESIEKTISDFNDDAGIEWFKDDKLIWHKKGIS